MPIGRSLLFGLFRGCFIPARIVEERAVRDGLNRREVAVSDPFRPRGLADVVRDRA